MIIAKVKKSFRKKTGTNVLGGFLKQGEVENFSNKINSSFPKRLIQLHVNFSYIFIQRTELTIEEKEKCIFACA